MTTGPAEIKRGNWLQRLLSRLRSVLRRGPGVATSEVDMLATYPEDVKEPEHIPGLEITVVFDPFIGVHELGKRGHPAQVHVQTGTVAYATHNQDPFDHDGLPEVYLDGETVSRSRFRRRDRCVVAVLATQPGRFWFRLAKWLPGISATEKDLAITQFLYFIRLVDPRRFLGSESRWPTAEGQDRLRRTVRDLVIRDVQGMVLDKYIQVWSSPQASDVADMLFSSLDRKLKEWGLAIAGNFVVQRRYPERLSELVLQFRAAERDLLHTRGVRPDIILARLGLGPADLMVLESETDKFGAGAGLFMATRRAKDKEPFIEWLRLEKASEAADFLEELYSEKFPPTGVELSENVVRSAFRHPMLGLGEWGDADMDLARTSDYYRLEGFFQAAAKES